MKVVIIEDEKPAVRLLERILKEIQPGIEIVHTISSVAEGQKWMSEEQVFDLLFMDIELEDGSSFEIFKKVLNFTKPIIITTAYDHYALEAFDLQSIAYVLKPLNKTGIENALSKLEKYKNVFVESESAVWPEKGLDEKIDKIMVRLGNRLIPVELSRSCSFYSKNKHTFLCTPEGINYPLNFTLDKLEQLLDKKSFFRMNRNAIVNRKSIVQIETKEKSKLEVQLKPEIPVKCTVSSEKSSAFKKWLEP